MLSANVHAMKRVACPHAGGSHALACHTWGPATAPVVLCVHGLTRNARDFDALVARLVPAFRLVSVDLPGRGDSELLADATLYNDDTYLADLQRVMNSFTPGEVRWVGTSLGGRLGMKMAAQDPERISALVLNDIGAEIDGGDLARLREQGAVEVSFANRADAEAWMRERYAAFGRLSDARWREFTAHSVALDSEGRYRPRFDQRAVPAARVGGRVDYWDLYRAIRCPVLVLRGADSQLLSRATCEAMVASAGDRGGPDTRWIEVPQAGHAPDLSLPGLVESIAEFLEEIR